MSKQMRQHSARHRTVETQSVSPSLFPQVLIRENNKSLRFQMKRFRPIAETLRVGFVGGGGSFSLLCTRVHPRHSAACGNVSPFCEAVLLGFAHHHLFCFVPLGKDGGGGQGPSMAGILTRALFLLCGWPHSCCIFIGMRKIIFLVSLLIRTLILFMRALPT